MTWSISTPLGARMWRPRPETMPRSAVRSRPNGLPIATAVSPTFTRLESRERERVDVRRVGGRDLQHGEVRGRVGAQDGGVDAVAVGPEAHGDLARAPDDVRVGDERPVAVEEEAGAGRATGADGHDGRAGRGVDRADRGARGRRLRPLAGRRLVVGEQAAGGEGGDEQQDGRHPGPEQQGAAAAARRCGLGQQVRAGLGAAGPWAAGRRASRASRRSRGASGPSRHRLVRVSAGMGHRPVLHRCTQRRRQLVRC